MIAEAKKITDEREQMRARRLDKQRLKKLRKDRDNSSGDDIDGGGTGVGGGFNDNSDDEDEEDEDDAIDGAISGDTMLTSDGTLIAHSDTNQGIVATTSIKGNVRCMG